ncbi:MAG: hypothetical protein ACOX6G_01730 [Christensenellales bacterium]|jgi:hypothetical protein
MIFLEDVNKNRTVRGVIDAYIRLPEEFTFDFSNNPNVARK